MQVAAGDTLLSIAGQEYQNLTTVAGIANASNLATSNLVQSGNTLSVPVNCFCGDPSLNRAYGLFTTYVVQATDQLTSIAGAFAVNADVISSFNSDVRTLTPYSIIFIPTRGI